MTVEIEYVGSNKSLHLACIKGDILKQVNNSMKKVKGAVDTESA